MARIALLAVAVNLVELLCSAGIPAVYTGILARADLPPLGHYLYLALYVLVFLADDTIIVVAAMTTLRLTGMDRGYARWVRLAGGALMLVLGLALIFRPDWLSFALY
jgi:threonine/homoserine/homoserine lactone efflux protein